MIELNIFQIVLILIAGFTAAVIGALPFGLVNLSVIDVTMRHGKRPAIMQINICRNTFNSVFNNFNCNEITKVVSPKMYWYLV